MSFVTERFQELEKELYQLVERHKQIGHEKLHLAICYGPERAPGDVFLFEVINNFGNNEIDPDQDLFEVEFSQGRHMSLSTGRKLHLVMTNPREFNTALDKNWQRLHEIRDAIHQQRYEVLFEDDEGVKLLERLADEESTR